MPAASKVRWAQLRVGLMAIVAMIILGALIWLLTGREPLFAEYTQIHTYLRDSGTLARGAPVRLSGIPVGNVAAVELAEVPHPDRQVRITLNIRREQLDLIPVDSVVEVAAENVLGARYINIVRGTAKETVRAGAELPGEPVAEIADLVRRGFDVFNSTQAILNRVDRLVAHVEAGEGSVGKFLVDDEFYNRLVATVADVQKVTHAVAEGQGTLGRLLYDEALYNDVRRVTARLDAIMLDLQQGQGTAGRLLRDPALYEETQATVAQARELIGRINAGEGTLGRLVRDETVYNQIQTLLARVDSTIERVNAGEGTLGRMLVDPQLYESVTGMTTEAQTLIQDIRADPAKFLRVRLSIF